MNSEAILQIFSGGFSGGAVPWEFMEEKLNSTLTRLPVRKVILGWSTGKDIYERAASFLAKRNIELYLWFPVFSETVALTNLSPLLDFRGRPVEGRAANKSENFAFCCPNNPHNIGKILDIFDSYFSSLSFSGVFLDKIRFPSFANGSLDDGLQADASQADSLQADSSAGSPGKSCVFSCFCPHCLALYEKLHIDAEKLKNALSRRYSAPMGIKEYSGKGRYIFEDETIKAFFSAKAEIIKNSLETICRHFREQGLYIGFDVFAPFLSPFVGQDLIELSKLCDFIKPMMYRLTNAPAGLPYETEALLRETGFAKNGNAASGFAAPVFANPDFSNPVFTAQELSGLASSSACPVYAGIEINRKKGIAEVYPAYIEETIKAYSSTGISGFALSWNLLDAPEENVAAAAENLEEIPLL